MWGWLIPDKCIFCVVKSISFKYLIFLRYGFIKYFYSRQLSRTNFVVDKINKIIYCEYWWYNFFTQNRFLSLLKGFDANLGCKLKFKRKGSWMRLKRRWPQCISLKVGLGHYQRIGSFDIIPIRYKKHLRRHSVFLVGLNWWNLLMTVKTIYSFRPMNIYTKRGIRLARQPFFRKQGKLSRYTAMKSKIF
jgi:hypothetical protein